MLLRRPDVAVRLTQMARWQTKLARLYLLLIAGCGAAFGAAVGSFRGGEQHVWAASKIPAATLLTLAVCGPAFVALAATFGRRWSLKTTLSLTLAAGARSSLVLLALTPVLWLTIDLGAPYGAIKLTATLCYGLAGLSALSLISRGLGRRPGRLGAAGAFIVVFALVGGQTAWLLRPYLGDPSDDVVPALAHGRMEGGLLGALWNFRR